MVLSSALLVFLGGVSPLIVSLLTKTTWSSKTKGLVAIAVSLVITVAWAASTGGITLVLGAGLAALAQSAVVAVGFVYGVQQLVFNFIFKGTEFAGALSEWGLTADESDAGGDGFIAELEPTDEDLGA